MFNKIIDFCDELKWAITTLYDVLFPEPIKTNYEPEEQEDPDGWIYMTLDESKQKDKEIKEGIQLLKDTLEIVEKPIDFGGLNRPYDRKESPTYLHVYGKTQAKYLHPVIRRLDPEELEDTEFDNAIDSQEGEDENT